MFWNKSEERLSEEPEKAEEVKEKRLFEPYRCWTIHIEYVLRNGKESSCSINYQNSDYCGEKNYKEAGEAMELNASNKMKEIEALVEANLGQESGWIKFGSNYIANRDLAKVSVWLKKCTSEAIRWDE